MDNVIKRMIDSENARKLRNNRKIKSGGKNGIFR